MRTTVNHRLASAIVAGCTVVALGGLIASDPANHDAVEHFRNHAIRTAAPLEAKWTNNFGLPLRVVFTPGYLPAMHVEAGQTVVIPTTYHDAPVWLTVVEDDGAGDFGTSEFAVVGT